MSPGRRSLIFMPCISSPLVKEAPVVSGCHHSCQLAQGFAFCWPFFCGLSQKQQAQTERLWDVGGVWILASLSGSGESSTPGSTRFSCATWAMSCAASCRYHDFTAMPCRLLLVLSRATLCKKDAGYSLRKDACRMVITDTGGWGWTGRWGRIG